MTDNKYCSSLNSKVKIGNWQEEVNLEEDCIGNFLEKEQSGNLVSQKLLNLKNQLVQEVQLSMPADGFVIPGDTYIIMSNLHNGKCSLAVHPTILNTDLTSISYGLTGLLDLGAKIRNSFAIERAADSSNKSPVLYGENIGIYCCLPEQGKMYIESCINSLPCHKNKCLQQEVTISPNSSRYTIWKIMSKDANWRMELEGSPVKVNQEVIFTHVFTNRHLGVESCYNKMTIFGNELEISAHPFSNKFCIADQRNLWTLKCRHNL